MLIRQQAAEGHLGHRRIGEHGVPVPVGQARRLDLQVQALHRQRFQFVEGEPGQDVEDFEGDDALAVGRALIDVVAAVGSLDGSHVLALGLGEVVQAVQSAEAVQVLNDVLGDGAPIEGVAPPFGDAAQGLRQLRLAVEVAGLRRLAAGQEDAGRGRVRAQGVGVKVPVEGDAPMDAIAVAGVRDGRLEQLAQALRAVVLDQPRPGVDGAGHGHRVGRGGIDLGDPLFGVPFGNRRRRRPARPVVGDHPVATAGREQGEAVAADARRPGLDHALDGTGRHRRVDGVAAVPQHLQRAQRGRRLRGGGHAVEGMDR